MPYVNVPADLSKIRSKVAFNLTRRQLICFGTAAAVGVPVFLLTRDRIGGTAAMLLMVGLMLPAFLLAMYERDGLPAEKVVRNILRSRFLRPTIRPYKTANFYAFLSKEDDVPVEQNKKAPARTKGAGEKGAVCAGNGAADYPIPRHAPGRDLPRGGATLHKDDTI